MSFSVYMTGQIPVKHDMYCCAIWEITMSKRNREKRVKKIIQPQQLQLIQQRLRSEFGCTEEQIELVEQALQRMIPQELAAYIAKCASGEITFPEDMPGIRLDMGKGNIQDIRLTNRPISLLYMHLADTYGQTFGEIYWAAIVAPNVQQFLEMLSMSKKIRNYENEPLQGRINDRSGAES